MGGAPPLSCRSPQAEQVCQGRAPARSVLPLTDLGRLWYRPPLRSAGVGAQRPREPLRAGGDDKATARHDVSPEGRSQQNCTKGGFGAIISTIPDNCAKSMLPLVANLGRRRRGDRLPVTTPPRYLVEAGCRSLEGTQLVPPPPQELPKYRRFRGSSRLR